MFIEKRSQAHRHTGGAIPSCKDGAGIWTCVYGNAETIKKGKKGAIISDGRRNYPGVGECGVNGSVLGGHFVTS